MRSYLIGQFEVHNTAKEISDALGVAFASISSNIMPTIDVFQSISDGFGTLYSWTFEKDVNADTWC